MPTHVVYIDDSGTKEYAASPESYGGSDGVSHYFVFGAALLTIDEAGVLSSKIIKLKLEYFGQEDVEIKSNWLRMPKERNRYYLEPFGLTIAELNDFVNKYYETIVSANLVFIASVIDKPEMQRRYPKPYYPPAVAYEIIMQRVENELCRVGTCSVICDDMTGKTPKGSEYKENLKNQHKQMKQHGSSLLQGMTFTCLPPTIKFQNSAHSHMVQAADIASYNVMRQFRDYGEDWEREGLDELPEYDYFRRIEGKFRHDRNGIVQGFGIIKFPCRKKIPWGVK